jgi:hypothetical protein
MLGRMVTHDTVARAMDVSNVDGATAAAHGVVDVREGGGRRGDASLSSDLAALPIAP